MISTLQSIGEILSFYKLHWRRYLDHYFYIFIIAIDLSPTFEWVSFFDFLKVILTKTIHGRPSSTQSFSLSGVPSQRSLVHVDVGKDVV